MAAIHFGDKLVPGLNTSVGLLVPTKPSVQVRLGGKDLPFSLVHLDDLLVPDRFIGFPEGAINEKAQLWKVRFVLPKDASGELEVSLQAGADQAQEKKAIG